MKRSLRQVVAVTLVATALCADRTVCAAPRRPQPAVNLAAKLVQRLRVGFRQVAPALRLYAVRSAAPAPVLLPLAILSRHFVPAILLHPFQFRTPPPTA